MTNQKKVCSLLVACFALLSITAQVRSTLPDYPDTLGVSGHFAGYVGGHLVVAGGCNFPNRPAADGGKKEFYATVYALSADGNRWERQPNLSQPIAYGACVETDSGLVCIGGMNANGACSAAFVLRFVGDSLRCVAKLPDLPVAIDNGGAAHIGADIYITGGRQSDGGCGLYVLKHGATSWQRLANYPRHVRQQPIVVAISERIFLIGGYDYDATQNKCTLAKDILAYNPTTNRWQREAQLPHDAAGKRRCIVGAAGCIWRGNIVVCGGVNADIFRTAIEGRSPKDYLRRPIAWYRFNADMLIYDVVQRSWQIIATNSAAARAGSVLVNSDDALIMTCGEEKPGIRSPRITRLDVSSLLQSHYDSP